MINPNLHKKPAVLDSNSHRDLKVGKPLDDWSVAANMNAMFVASVEFGDVCLEYPILFVNAGNDTAGTRQVAPIAVFGLSDQENLYVEGSTLRAGYVPALLRAYPFGVARVADDRVMVIIDEGWSGWSKDSGQPLFDAEGKPTDYVSGVRDHLEKVEIEIQRTRLFGQALIDADLLAEMRFDAELPTGQKLSVDGFLTVDEKKLGALSDEKILELSKNGAMALIHAHQVSMRHMRKLVDWRLAREAAAAAAPKP